MWLPVKKKGVSIMVGYVLLVTCAIIISVLVYQWIKTYIPTEALECPDEVSIFIKEYTYDCTSGSEKLTIILKNNGMFNTAGYFIHATNKTDQELATIDLSNYTKLGENKGGTVLFSQRGENSFEPNDEITNVFDLADSGIGQIYSIEVIPVRFHEADNKMRFVICGDSRVKEAITCGGVEVPPTCGDGIEPPCDPGETCLNCPGDCGVCCGNGLVDGFAGEECDGTNLSEQTCTSVMGGTGDLSCYPPEHTNNCTFNTTGCTGGTGIDESIVFVSSTTFNGNLGGISGADAECNTLAGTAGLSGTFVAWLSNSTLNAKDRIPTDIPFNRTDGVRVADNLADLLDGTIDIKISVNENGAPPDDIKDSVWTGTNETGHAKVIVGNHCNNWQSSASGDKGLKGKSDESTLKWTNEKEETCNEIYRIYCFQIS